MTEDELTDFLDWCTLHTYQARRPDINNSVFTVKAVHKHRWDGKEYTISDYTKWSNRFFARSYLNPDHTETEPFSYQNDKL